MSAYTPNPDKKFAKYIEDNRAAKHEEAEKFAAMCGIPFDFALEAVCAAEYNKRGVSV